jgi:peptidoglycan hydrolase CwlO-like protein
MSEVVVNFKGNTSAATAAVDELNDSVKDVGKSTQKVNAEQEQLEKTLKKQEATIKTIDGAINLLEIGRAHV